MKTKICTKCKKELPATTEYFYKYKSSKDGLRWLCKKCTYKRDKKAKEKKKQKFDEIYNSIGRTNLYKVCSKCGKKLPATDEHFFKSLNGKYGLRSKCRDCFEKQSKVWKQKPESRKRARIKGKEHYHANKEEYAKRWKKYYEENRGWMLERGKKYKKENPEKVKFNHSRQGHKRDGNPNLEHDLTLQQWRDCKGYFINSCAYCGSKENIQHECFIPLSADGRWTKDNVLPACPSCNSSKNNRDFFEWYSKQDFYSEKRKAKILKYLKVKEPAMV